MLKSFLVRKDMRFKLFTYLYYAIPKPLEDTRSKRYYDLHSSLLSSYEETRRYLEARTNFEIIKANIIIAGLQSKKRIEEIASLAQKTGADPKRSIDLKEMPSFKEDGQRIIIPFFSKTINSHYLNDPLSLNHLPYKALKSRKSFTSFYEDPFRKYGYKLFDTAFTRLIPIVTSPKKDSRAYLDLEVDTLYIITDQGTLEQSIPFFDSNIEYPNRLHLLDRVKTLVNAYYAFDQQGFINYLVSLGFISDNLYNVITQERIKEETRADKVKEKKPIELGK